MNWRVFGVCLLVLVLPAGWGIAQRDQDKEGEIHAAVLKTAGIPADLEGLLAYLGELRIERIKELAAQLDADGFKERRAATEALIRIGPAVADYLRKIRGDSGPEVRFRIDKILKEVATPEGIRRHSRTLDAVIGQLETLGDPRALKPLFGLLESTSDPVRVDAIKEAIWAGSEGAPVATMEESLGSSNSVLKTAAIVALEIAESDAAVVKLEPLLSHRDASVRLAACRALLDRKPEAVMKTLVALTGAEDDSGLAFRAEALLVAQTGIKAGYQADRSRSEIWQAATRELKAAQLKPLGAKRHDLGLSSGNFIEMFARDSGDVKAGYGPFRYESASGTKAYVKDGRLRIEGDLGGGVTDADHYFYIPAQALTGAPVLPDSFTVSAKLGATEGGSGVFHVGITLGDLKILFHPSYAGGGFRFEDRKTREFHTNNSNMGFTPQPGSLIDMKVTVWRKQDGQRMINVEMRDPETKNAYEAGLEATDKQLGAWDQIGLIRSGRRGGDAMFSNFRFQRR